MKRVLVTRFLAFSVFAASTLAQPRLSEQGGQTPNVESQSVRNHVITVSRAGEAYAKPDLGIMIMSIRSSSPIAAEAVAENARKAKVAEASLTGLGFAPSGYQLTSVIFGQAGATRYASSADSEYDATQYIYVFFEGADLNNMELLTEKSASVIEALRKAGAVPANAGPQLSPVAAQGALIIYTIKDAAPYEHKALQMAIGRARDAAQDVAAATGVQITGLRNVQSGYLSGNVVPRTGSSPLEGLKYRWFTTKSDQLQIIANATVEYDFK